jgi:hypothetical protein
LGALIERQEQNLDQLVQVDLGSSSLLEEFYADGDESPDIRVGDYNPHETASYHSSGRHVYVVNRRVLESDVIISIPKLKTHQKVGISCALKGTVGTIARKECLAHHRKGSPDNGGDEFPNSAFLRNLASDISDATANNNHDLSSNFHRVAGKILNRALRIGPRGIMGGAWHGNDTAWRMTLDIARILRFADVHGKMHATPQRKHISLVDGIVAGEGDGPLSPSPRHAGAILFGSDVCAVDAACALVMGFDPVKIPLIYNSFLKIAHPVTELSLSEVLIELNGEMADRETVLSGLLPFEPTKGWSGNIEASERHK